MYCTKCGKEIDNNSTFCPFCGQKVGALVENKKSVNSSNPAAFTVKKFTPIIAVVIAVLLAIAGITKLIRGSDKESATAISDIEETGEDTTESEEDIISVESISEAKMIREQTRSKNKEILMELINNTNITDEEKQVAIDEMVQMTDIAEKELAAETLLIAQGFDEVLVNISDSSANVVISSAEVSDSQRAQIEDIVKRKTGISPENITITLVTASE